MLVPCEMPLLAWLSDCSAPAEGISRTEIRVSPTPIDQTIAPVCCSQLVQGSTVLVLPEGDHLWQAARVSAVDGEKLAVRLAQTQKEIGCTLGSVFPIEQDGDEDMQLPGEC